MDAKLEDFIYDCAEFNACTFCNEFGFRKNCPVKNAYKDNEEPTDEEINRNRNICKKYVIASLKSIISARLKNLKVMCLCILVRWNP